jgi:hypothetical protein
VDAPPGGRFEVVMFKYPTLRHLPEILGLGEGYGQLYEIGTGRVLQEKSAEELSAIRMFAWSNSSVSVQGFVEWPLPKWWQELPANPWPNGKPAGIQERKV